MANYKNQYKVDVTTAGGYTASFDDSKKDGSGSAAYMCVTGGKDIRSYVDDNEVVIPFHAVDRAVITFTRAEVEAPADETCPA